MNLVNELKHNHEDFEWYPTTDEIIHRIYHDIKNTFEPRISSILDIGAGDGRVLEALDDLTNKKYAIEKSYTHINNLPSDVFLIGTDFHEQTLIDKEVDAIFCNPPYTEFSEWTSKILKEGFCKYIYMVIPDRWKNDRNIQSALDDSKWEHVVLGKYDFLDADRQARCNVE